MPQARVIPTPEPDADEPARPLPDRAGMQDKIARARDLLHGLDLPKQVEVKIKEPNEVAETAKAKTKQPETVESEPKKAETQDKGPPKGLKDLADKLGMKVKDLYAIEVSIADGDESRTMTLGQLKDAYEGSTNPIVNRLVDERIKPKEAELTARQLEFSEKQSKHDLDVAQTREQLALLVKALPKNALDPQVLAEVARQRDAYVAQEVEKLSGLLPSWSDQAVRSADLKAMTEHVTPYGLGAGFINSLNDSRLIKYVHDNWQREQRVKQAMEKVEQERATPLRNVASTQKPAARPAAPVALPANASPRQKASSLAHLFKP